jgi:hypothetical protein
LQQLCEFAKRVLVGTGGFIAIGVRVFVWMQIERAGSTKN